MARIFVGRCSACGKDLRVKEGAVRPEMRLTCRCGELNEIETPLRHMSHAELIDVLLAAKKGQIDHQTSPSACVGEIYRRIKHGEPDDLKELSRNISTLCELVAIDATPNRTVLIDCLGLLGEEPAIRTLIELSNSDTCSDVRSAAIRSLGNLFYIKYIHPFLERAVKEGLKIIRPHPSVSYTLPSRDHYEAHGIAHDIILVEFTAGDEAIVHSIGKAAVGDVDEGVRQVAVDTLRNLKHRDGRMFLTEAMQDSNDAVREIAEDALSELDQALGSFDLSISPTNTEGAVRPDDGRVDYLMGALVNPYDSVGNFTREYKTAAKALPKLWQKSTDKLISLHCRLGDPHCNIADVILSIVDQGDEACQYLIDHIGYLPHDQGVHLLEGMLFSDCTFIDTDFTNFRLLSKCLETERICLMALEVIEEGKYNFDEATPLLARAAADESLSPDLRGKLEEALERLNAPKKAAYANAKRIVTESLDQRRDAQAVQSLIKVLGSTDPDTRQAAIEVLKQSNKLGVVDLMIVALKDKTYLVRDSASEVLAEIGDKRAVRPLIKALWSPRKLQSWERKPMVRALGRLGDQRAVKHLLKLFQQCLEIQDPRAPSTDIEPIAEALGRIGDVKAVAPLSKAMQTVLTWEWKWDSFRAIVAALNRIGDARAVEPLIDVLRVLVWDDAYYDIQNVATVLGEIGDARAIEPLKEVLRIESDDCRKAAAEALGKIGKI